MGEDRRVPNGATLDIVGSGGVARPSIRPGPDPGLLRMRDWLWAANNFPHPE